MFLHTQGFLQIDKEKINDKTGNWAKIKLKAQKNTKNH